MFGRINQLLRHISRPLPNYAHSSAATSPAVLRPSPMTSSAIALENSKKTIHTAACLIIGDEVLGGKVSVKTVYCLSFRGVFVAFKLSSIWSRDSEVGGGNKNTVTDWLGSNQTVDTNSSFFAKYCFSLGITLKRVEVIPDDESEIIEAVRRMSEKYDFVVTSGGIGPTSVHRLRIIFPHIPYIWFARETGFLS